ncbi:MAG: hypothetical protein M1827_002965 [Pycnora praestabilis]|nr:MAG: hypothetical protein M1827_002965 [Pycnora praestabilis]
MLSLLPQSALAAIIYILALPTAYAFSLAIYRVYLSPTRRFPGPRLAAATGWYEFYYDVLQSGQYFIEIERMHKVYGPIVRINPREVHIKDPEFFDKLYSASSKLEKDGWYYFSDGVTDSAFATPEADLHRARRGPLAKFFSMGNVLHLEPLIVECATKLIGRLEEHKKNGTPVNLSNGYRCLTTDVITQYSFPRAQYQLDAPDFASDFHKSIRDSIQAFVFKRHLPFVLLLMKTAPQSLLKIVGQEPPTAVLSLQADFRAQAREVTSSKMTDESKKPCLTVLEGIYRSDLPQNQRTVARLARESQTLLFAGTETTGNALSVLTYYLLTHPDKAERLKKELKDAQPKPTETMSFQYLQNLPYLSAVITEGLRITTSVAGRLPRINKTQPMIYGSLVIPPGTVVSMSIPDVHMDKSVFENPHEFQPERWMDPAKKKALERFLVPFSRGPRNCLGMNLAQAEMYLTLGNLFRRLDLELFETTKRDVSAAHDLFAGYAPRDSEGLRVTVH